MLRTFTCLFFAATAALGRLAPARAIEQRGKPARLICYRC